MAEKIISNIEFLDDSTESAENKVYLLVDEQSASTIGAFSTEDNVIQGIKDAIGAGYRPSQLWGQIYDLDRLI